jgi:hypothetical protein
MLEQNQKIIAIPREIRFALVWTLFFAILGIIIQSVQANSLILGDFFAQNFIVWIKSFGSFSDITLYTSSADFFYSLIAKWYYFLYAGGLISLLWGILSWIIHLEIRINPKEQNKGPAVKQENKIIINQSPTVTQRSSLEEWIDQGLLFLSQNNLSEAKLIYEQVRLAYDSSQDSNGKIYRKIIDFYNELSQIKK